MTLVESESVLVLGAGNFGTCLADHLADLGNAVTIWARDAQLVDDINTQHRNTKYIPDVDLSKNLKATSRLDHPELFKEHSVILVAIPTQHMRSILKHIAGHVSSDHLLIFVSKGIEISSGLLPNDMVKEVLGPQLAESAVFLSGPSFAAEVVRRLPTCVSVASQSSERALRTQSLFHAPHFRVYDSQDTVGIEVAGALKNVIAIASGAVSGLGLQMNTRAALITRGLAEITRFGIALGANPMTFSGLAGVGDLFLTCTSDKSRNFRVGYLLGQGKTLEDIIAHLGSVAEGVPTAKAAFELGQKLKVDCPITTEVYAVLYQGKPVDQAMRTLMERDPSSELRGIPY